MKKAIIHAANLAQAAIRDVLTGSKRSPKWPKVEHAHLAKHPTCAACGSTKNLNVHHIKPFHLHPNLELDPTNLITLCMDNDCHLLIGHGGNFKAYNPNVVTESAEVLKQQSRIKTAIKEMAIKAKKERLFE